MKRLSKLPVYQFLLIGAIIGVLLVGCATRSEPEENKAATHLRKIAVAYNEVNYRGRLPRSVEDLKPILEGMSEPDGLDVLLHSPNDGEPYEIVWGLNLERVTDGSLLVAYEKKGVEGKRYAINAARVVKHLTDAEIEGAIPKGKRPGGR